MLIAFKLVAYKKSVVILTISNNTGTLTDRKGESKRQFNVTGVASLA